MICELVQLYIQWDINYWLLTEYIILYTFISHLSYSYREANADTMFAAYTTVPLNTNKYCVKTD
jgi:hypothetical protein